MATKTHQGLRAARTLVLGLLLTLMGGSAIAAPEAAMEDVSVAFGLHEIPGYAIATGWLDIDLDGENEAYFITSDQIFYLDDGPDGLVMLEATFISPDGKVSGSPIGSVVFDADRDGVSDLLILTYELRLYRVASPGVLEMMDVTLPRVPGSRLPNDAAAADLNGDGFPDVVIAMAGLVGDASVLLGAKDMILMNRGGAHFELIDLLPAKKAMTHSITLADLDFDGRVDYMESVNFSGMTGPSRILFNRTEPGALVPVFELSEYSFDRESFGMGAAVEDVDGDGILDVYNTSAGRDYMMLGSADGTYRDDTFALGFFHEYASPPGFRIQWSPTFDDMNGDGLLDLFIRHGHTGDLQVTGLGAKDAESPLLYVGQSDGTFKRFSVPYDPEAPIGGIDAALGDLNGDGLPDVAMGNTLASWGRGDEAALPPGVDANPSFLLNVSEVPASTRTLTIHLEPTLSADPPVGARLSGTCGGVTQHRYLTGGGKMGAGTPSEFHVAWPGCEAEPEIVIDWPSGVRSVHAPGVGNRRMWAEEPEAWKLVSGDEGAWSLALDPLASGHEEVCAREQKAEEWTCCDTVDGPCVLDYAPAVLDRWLVRVGEGQTMTLPPLSGQWRLYTIPRVPRPGEAYQVEAAWSGLPGTLDPDAVWLRVDGEKVPWVSVEGPVFRATLQAPDEAAPLSLSLLVTTKIVKSHTANMGIHFDPSRMDHALIPSEYPTIGMPWLLLVATSVGLTKEDMDLSKISIRTGDGLIVPSNRSLADSLGTVEIQVPWKHAPVGETVTVYDGETPVLGPLPLYHEMPAEDLKGLIAEARGFSLRTSVVEGGDTTRVFFTLVDSQGFLLPPNLDLLEVEVKGGELTDELATVEAPGALIERRWEVSVGIRADEGVGTGELRVFLKDGPLLGRWFFERRARVYRPVDPDKSYLTLGHQSIPAGVGATTELRIYPMNAYGEMIGMDATVEVKHPGFVRLGPLEVTSGGFYIATVYADFFGGEVPFEVTLNGEVTLTETLEVVGPQLPAIDLATATWPGSDASDVSPPTDASDPPEPTPPSSGCAADPGRHHGPLGMLALALLCLVLGRRVRVRR